MVPHVAPIHPEHLPITVLPCKAGPGCSQPPSHLYQAEQPRPQQAFRDGDAYLLIQTVRIDSAFLSMNVVKWSSHQQEVRGPIHVNVHRAQLRAKIGSHLQPRRNSAHKGTGETSSDTPQQGRFLLLLFLDYQFGSFWISLFTRVTKKPG